MSSKMYLINPQFGVRAETREQAIEKFHGFGCALALSAAGGQLNAKYDVTLDSVREETARPATHEEADEALKDRPVTMRVPSTYDALKALATDSRSNVGSVIRQAISEYLRN